MAKHLASLTRLRHTLHANPRVSNNEAETAARLQDYLKSFGLQPSMTNVGGGHGMIFAVEGKQTTEVGHQIQRQLHSRSTGGAGAGYTKHHLCLFVLLLIY